MIAKGARSKPKPRRSGTSSNFVGADTNSERAIRWPIALMVLRRNLLRNEVQNEKAGKA